MKTVCLVHCADLQIAQSQMFGVAYMPVWIYTLAPYLRRIQNVRVQMFDNRIQKETQIPEADIFLFSGINQDHQALLRMLKNLRAKNPSSQFVIGGPICWSFHVAGQINKLFDFDHIVIGDGEPVVQDIVCRLVENEELPKVLNPSKKFEVQDALPMDKVLLKETVHNYYGGVIEVSRGCPFLCEFCDIRIQPDNNRPHNANIDLILEELEFFAKNGVPQVLFACDNFIGDPRWAEQVCDGILSWREKTGYSIGIYTWLTINVARYPRLLKKMRHAGFDMFFIGIESFGHNQLLETAKVQNVKGSLSLADSISVIQSYGFIIVAGLIFGFDSDPDNVSEITLNGIEDCGLISGDPSLLTALPGTPLYKRMKMSGRLRDGKLGLGGHKYCTNIKYLKTEDQMISVFADFVKNFNTGSYQFNRLRNFYKTLELGNFISVKKEEYISVAKLMRIVVKNPWATYQLIRRFFLLVASWDRLRFISKALFLTRQKNTKDKNLWVYFKFWLFVWSNSIVKYSKVSSHDFDIGYVGDDFPIENILPPEYGQQMDEPIPLIKIKSQRKSTLVALGRLIEEKRGKVSGAAPEFEGPV